MSNLAKLVGSLRKAAVSHVEETAALAPAPVAHQAVSSIPDGKQDDPPLRDEYPRAVSQETPIVPSDGEFVPSDGEFVPIADDALPTIPPTPIESVDEKEERDAATHSARHTASEHAPKGITLGRTLPEGRKPDVVLKIPAPRPHQRVVLDDDHRFKGWRAGRRVGKSRTEFIAAVRGHGPIIQVDVNGEMVMRRKFKGMAQGGDIAWIAPDFPQSDTIWEEEVLPRFYGRAGVTVSEKHRLIGLGKQLGEDANGEPVYQGSLRIRSAENINSVRGKEFDGIIGEEAAFWPFLTYWRRVLRPTLINRKGWAIIASSTDLGSDFNQLMQEIEAGKRGANWGHFHNRTRDNPFIDEDEKADLATDYPPGSAEELQELDAELLESLGTLFRKEFFHTYDAVSRHAVWIGGLRYEFEFLVMTVDVAASLKEKSDYTAITIAGVCYPIDGVRRVAILEVTNEHLEGPEQIAAMRDIALRWRPGYIDIETYGYQLTAVQHLKTALAGHGLTIDGITLKGDKRQKAVPAAAAMSRGEWFFPKSAPWLDDTKAQLLKFPNGRDGSKLVADHDDIVDTLSLLAARVGGRSNSTWKMRKILTR